MFDIANRVANELSKRKCYKLRYMINNLKSEEEARMAWGYRNWP